MDLCMHHVFDILHIRRVCSARSTHHRRGEFSGPFLSAKGVQRLRGQKMESLATALDFLPWKPLRSSRQFSREMRREIHPLWGKRLLGGVNYVHYQIRPTTRCVHSCKELNDQSNTLPLIIHSATLLCLVKTSSTSKYHLASKFLYRSAYANQLRPRFREGV